MIFELSNNYSHLLLFSIGLTAGIVDAVAGGGGLISLPMLLAFNIPPNIALGTNKLQTSVGTLISTLTYYREKLISIRLIYKGLIWGFLGATLGAELSQICDSSFLTKLLPFLLLMTLVYTIFSPNLGRNEDKPKLSEFWYYIIFGFLLGFYDGFFGPGTGALWVFCNVYLLGYNLLKATAYTKIFNLKSNIIATIYFAFNHSINYKIALLMAIGQILGGKIGALIAIKKGVHLIRPVFIIVVSVSIASLLYSNYTI